MVQGILVPMPRAPHTGMEAIVFGTNFAREA
jgi:hypothetical protein